MKFLNHNNNYFFFSNKKKRQPLIEKKIELSQSEEEQTLWSIWKRRATIGTEKQKTDSSFSPSKIVSPSIFVDLPQVQFLSFLF